MSTNHVDPSPKKSVDVLLICALKDELDQLTAVSTGLSSKGWVQTNGSDGRIMSDAQFKAIDGRTINIRATWAGYMGREQAQAVMSTCIREDNVKCVAMSGICAGRRGKVELGDVIFAERLWSYDSGKSVVTDGRENFQGDMLQYRPPEVWVQHMQNIKTPDTAAWLLDRPKLPLEHQENWVLKCLQAGVQPSEHSDFDDACPDWTDVIHRLWERDWVTPSLELTEQGKAHISHLSVLYPRGLPAPPAFQTHVAPMATGAVVKEDENIFSSLSGSMRKTLGLDMEASGLAASADALRVPLIVAKGVSDFGDKYKDDRYRHFAARASAESLISLLRSVPHLLLPASQATMSSNEDASLVLSSSNDSFKDRELINLLAELFPAIDDARALWERAGGSSCDVDNVSNPRNLWQKLWRRSSLGASVSQASLLSAVLEDYPENTIIQSYLNSVANEKKQPA